MPAAAVIPAPIAYTNVVAVKKLVVGFLGFSAGRLLGVVARFASLIFSQFSLALTVRIARLHAGDRSFKFLPYQLSTVV